MPTCPVHCVSVCRPRKSALTLDMPVDHDGPGFAVVRQSSLDFWGIGHDERGEPVFPPVMLPKDKDAFRRVKVQSVNGFVYGCPSDRFASSSELHQPQSRTVSIRSRIKRCRGCFPRNGRGPTRLHVVPRVRRSGVGPRYSQFRLNGVHVFTVSEREIASAAHLTTVGVTEQPSLAPTAALTAGNDDNADREFSGCGLSHS